jgi:hypothetical protein
VTFFDAGSGKRRSVPIRLEAGFAYAADPKRDLIDTGWGRDKQELASGLQRV